jgi:hypothetical protein
MDNLPAWGLWIITAAVGLSPGLALLLLVRPIARLLHRVLWPRAGGSASAEKGTGAPRAGQPSSSVKVNAR